MQDEKTKANDIYKDELQESVEILKRTASMVEEQYPSDKIGVKDIVMDILFFFLTVAGAFGWMLLMLLIISFVTLSYLHFEIAGMLLISAIFASIIAIYYIVKKAGKYLK